MSFRSIVGLVSSLFYVSDAQSKFLSSVQILVNKELFHQSSFYFINIASSVHLLFKQRRLHFSREKSPGEKCSGECPRPDLYGSVNSKLHFVLLGCISELFTVRV